MKTLSDIIWNEEDEEENKVLKLMNQNCMTVNCYEPKPIKDDYVNGIFCCNFHPYPSV